MTTRPGQSGASLIEVLVALLVITLGLMGLAGLQTRTLAARLEADDRLEALLRLDDLLTRLRVDSACLTDPHPELACPGLDHSSAQASRFITCLVADEAPQWRLSVAWPGVYESAPPTDPCGAGRLGVESKRRVISTVWLWP
jgi:type IV pilus assembly protein PilV